MSALMERSGRRSDRVVEPTVTLADSQGPGAIRAPESVVTGGAPALEPEGRPERVSRRRLDVVSRGLSDRERAILKSVQEFRFLTTRQIERLHFVHHASAQAAARICRRVLARLHRLRVIEHLDRRVGGIRAGSASYVWRVGLIGDRILRQESGHGTPRRRKEPSERHLDHCLAIADCYLAVIGLAQVGRIEIVAVDTEPASWRSYLAPSGGRETLKPDLYLVTANGEYEDHWFVEVDRGTESLPTLIKKCRQYENYRRTGIEQADNEVYPRVLWVMASDAQEQRLHDALATDRRIDADLFRLTTASDIAQVLAGAAS